MAMGEGQMTFFLRSAMALVRVPPNDGMALGLLPGRDPTQLTGGDRDDATIAA
jgi:hypothetical protein